MCKNCISSRERTVLATPQMRQEPLAGLQRKVRVERHPCVLAMQLQFVEPLLTYAAERCLVFRMSLSFDVLQMLHRELWISFRSTRG